LQKPLDFFGVHFNLTLPANASVAISGADFQLIAGLNHGDRFGIGPGVPTDIVPDFGDTLLLFALSLMALIVTRMIQMRFNESRRLQRSSVRFATSRQGQRLLRVSD